MLSASLDVSDVVSMLDSADDQIGETPGLMFEGARDMTEELRATDPYQNRTGQLRTYTQSFQMPDGAVAEMAMFYASFVQNKGYSNFDEVADKTKAEVVTRITAAFERIGR